MMVWCIGNGQFVRVAVIRHVDDEHRVKIYATRPAEGPSWGYLWEVCSGMEFLRDGDARGDGDQPLTSDICKGTNRSDTLAARRGPCMVTVRD